MRNRIGSTAKATICVVKSVFDDPDVTFFATVFAIGAVVVASIWFLWVVPSERRYHERKLGAVQEQIRRREEMLKNENSDASAGGENFEN